MTAGGVAATVAVLALVLNVVVTVLGVREKRAAAVSAVVVKDHADRATSAAERSAEAHVRLADVAERQGRQEGCANCSAP